jgi:hypothetical protein
MDKAKAERTAGRIVDAIARLKAGQPTHPELRLRTVARVSVQTVAMEAGISRAALYRYHKPLLLAISDTARENQPARVSRRRRIEEELRREIVSLESRLNDAISENALLLHRLTVAEDRLRRGAPPSRLGTKENARPGH